MEVLLRELNLREELIKEMVKLEFSEVSINWMRSQSGTLKLGIRKNVFRNLC